MLEQANINENTTFHHLSNQQLTHLAEHFKQFIFTVNGTLSIERAFVTGGGVSLKEIWPKTMMSKIQPGFFMWRSIRHSWVYRRLQYYKCFSYRPRRWKRS